MIHKAVFHSEVRLAIFFFFLTNWSFLKTYFETNPFKKLQLKIGP